MRPLNVGEEARAFILAGMLSSGTNKVKFVFFMASITSISGVAEARIKPQVGA